jgi:hypothetical protein
MASVRSIGTLARKGRNGQGSHDRNEHGGRPERKVGQYEARLLTCGTVDPKGCCGSRDERMKPAWALPSVHTQGNGTAEERPPRAYTGLSSPNRRMRTRMSGGVTGNSREGLPMSIVARSHDQSKTYRRVSQGSHGSRRNHEWRGKILCVCSLLPMARKLL